jgi:hypothetical protein
VTAASLALFNPLVNPRVSFVVTLPDVVVTRYAEGGSKALADFSAVVAAKGALDGASWVQATLLPGASLSINATVSCCASLRRYSDSTDTTCNCTKHSQLNQFLQLLQCCTTTEMSCLIPYVSYVTDVASFCCRCGSPATTPTSPRRLRACQLWTTLCSCSASCRVWLSAATATQLLWQHVHR